MVREVVMILEEGQLKELEDLPKGMYKEVDESGRGM